MGMFVKQAKSFGVDKVNERAALLKRVFESHGIHGELLFYICGYDYIQCPTDAKFNGLREQWLSRNSNLAYSYLNLGSSYNNVVWTRIAQAIPQPAAATAQNFSQMHKALDIAAGANMVYKNITQALANPNAKAHHLNTWAQEADDLSSTLAPYWGEQLTRIGLKAMPSQNVFGKIKNHIQLKKQQQDDLAALMNMPTRSRTSFTGPTRVRR